MANPSTVNSTVSVGDTPGGRSLPKKSAADPWKRMPAQCVAGWFGWPFPWPVALASVPSTVEVVRSVSVRVVRPRRRDLRVHDLSRPVAAVSALYVDGYLPQLVAGELHEFLAGGAAGPEAEAVAVPTAPIAVRSRRTRRFSASFPPFSSCLGSVPPSSAELQPRGKNPGQTVRPAALVVRSSVHPRTADHHS